MHWEESGIVLSIHKHGETSGLLRVFTRDHGIHAGLLKGAFSKSRRGLAMPGNLLNLRWHGRLAEHLGNFQAEMERPIAALILSDAPRLALLTAITQLYIRALPEHDPHPELYEHLHSFLETLSLGRPSLQDDLIDYIQLEMQLLRDLGFGLDLQHCAATGSNENLCYVSPKSGRAVSREAGAPYQDKLLPLPAFLNTNKTPQKTGISAQEIIDGLSLTGYFLEHWMLSPHGSKLPDARHRLTALCMEAT